MEKYLLHSHTHYCDGKADPELFVIEAITKGFSTYGISSHAPIDIDVPWCIKPGQMERYSAQLDSLKEKYGGEVCLLKSLEVDFVPGVSKSFDWFRKKYQLDYVIGSVHLVAGPEGRIWFIDGPQSGYDQGIVEVFGGDGNLAAEYYWKQVLEMIETQQPDMVGHIDKVRMNNEERFFSTQSPRYIELASTCLQAMKVKDIVLEINTRGIYKGKTANPFPDWHLIDLAREMGLRMSVNADAHQLHEIDAEYEQCCTQLKQRGVKEIWNRNASTWYAIEL